jgi:hypothetical protein
MYGVKMQSELPEVAARLKALMDYCVLDTPPEELFDQTARLAAYLCGTPIGLIGYRCHSALVQGKSGLGVSRNPTQRLNLRPDYPPVRVGRDIRRCDGRAVLQWPDGHACGNSILRRCAALDQRGIRSRHALCDGSLFGNSQPLIRMLYSRWLASWRLN